jgi:hypothetical protein
MAFFEDSSDYSYNRRDFYRPGTRNIGWLSIDREFPKHSPSEEELDLIWVYCKCSVAQSRGIHDCELCPAGGSRYAMRKGESLLLGSAEIRVFGKGDTIYAAPTLIYHYVAAHEYKPPEEFIRALREGPLPASQEYVDRLQKLSLKWHATFSAAEKPSGNIVLPGGPGRDSA